MIVRMSRIMVMGPKELMMDTLSLLHQMGIMHIDTESEEIPVEEEVTLPELTDTRSVLQHQYYENLSQKIEELLKYLPPADDQTEKIAPPATIAAFTNFLDSHIETAKSRFQRIEGEQKEIRSLKRYKTFLEALGDLEEDKSIQDIDWLGVGFENREDLLSLQEEFENTFGGKTVIEAVGAEKKPDLALITTKKELYRDVMKVLDDKGVKIYPPPEEMRGRPVNEQKKLVEDRIGEKEDDISRLQEEQNQFAARWLPQYLKIKRWVDSQISLIQVSASIVQTRMCFFIYGWLPESEFKVLRQKLDENFAGKVLVEESEIAEKDFSRVPTALSNPAYFEPFELFTRLLPMPPYASFDLTPFIGIFFPIFFGMMLGDMGYGLLLLFVALFLVRRFPARKTIRDAGKILFISSLYTVLFGFLYGEFFGTLGHTYLHLEPVLIDRHNSIVALFCFAVAVGVVHVLIGLVLGVILALKHHATKEAVVKMVNIFIILCLTLLIISYFMPAIDHVQQPLLITIGIVVTILIIVGGLIAPLELLKNVGNIISYARIMAIGLTSVLLAYVANYMAGRIGSVWAGILVAILLHFFNILLGVFAPTIHSLRLHYVEFLSKFMGPGGKEFKPLGGNK